ncbi:hypothetical protein BDA96_08G144100 [Sorghum bicolor]|uniref:Uncharacterized protein n=1 Tax=Sorghum bicolor TaxID=4558 RepID=A0A921QGP0_SORBI|nr:hypothetical protein BDA96_08G144100 [Sorghum bicolor]
MRACPYPSLPVFPTPPPALSPTRRPHSISPAPVGALATALARAESHARLLERLPGASGWSCLTPLPTLRLTASGGSQHCWWFPSTPHSRTAPPPGAPSRSRAPAAACSVPSAGTPAQRPWTAPLRSTPYPAPRCRRLPPW